MKTRKITLSIIALPLVSALAFGGSQSGYTQQRNSEVNLQTGRVHQFVKAKKFIEAERALVQLGSYKETVNIEEEWAGLRLWQQDYSSSLTYLTTYFEGPPGTAFRTVAGSDDLRIWYWFLLVQRGKAAKADTVLDELLINRVHVPLGAGWLKPKEVSNVKLAQVYIYMAAHKVLQGNYNRVDRYVALAKLADPLVKIDANFDSQSRLHNLNQMRVASEANELN
jgi:hypothetical protein